jgi:GntR family transcriptional regulator
MRVVPFIAPDPGTRGGAGTDAPFWLAALAGRVANADPALPKYAQLRQALAAAIDAGVWPAGDSLPSEQDLARFTPFSLGTVQRAIRALVDEGRLRRLKGRGTFVTEGRKGIAQPFLHTVFIDDATGGVLPVFPTMRSRRRIRERGPWSDLLGQHGANILRIERRLDIAGRFDAFSRFFINAERYARFAALPDSQIATGNLKLILAREHNLPTLELHQTLQLGAVGDDVAAELGVRPRSTCATLAITVVTATEPVTTVYFHQIYFPPNRATLRLPTIVLRTGR